MPRPKNKKELLDLSNANFKKLNSHIDSMSPEKQKAEFHTGTMNRNIGDVLAHLHHWHEMMLHWYEVGMRDEKPEMPAPGYTWKTVPELNRKIWEQYHGQDLDSIRKQLDESYNKVHSIINTHTDDELFEKKRYKWTGSTSLGTYLISATSSHYDWALKMIKKGFK